MRLLTGYSLWLGHSGDIRDLAGLHAAGIVAVVDLSIQDAPAAVGRELVYGRFPIVDGPGNPAWRLRAAVDLVAGLLMSKVPTLVACGAGMSRSPCIAGAAIARIRGCPADEGLAIALRSSPGPVDISPGLWAEVRQALA